MVSTNEYITDTKATKSMYVAAGSFLLVLVLNISLYFYNASLLSTSEKYTKEIVTLEESIKKVNNDDKVTLYTLIQANKIFLDKYAYLSKIPEFINNIKELSKTFQVTFENFTYSNSTINFSALAVDDAVSLGYEKTKKFIWNFRDKWWKDIPLNNQLFSLHFIDAFQWQNQIRFNVNFKLK